MDSVPQELIDTIIGNVPQCSLPSCSLVAKRWRRKSQQRALSTISFSSEDQVKRWCRDIPQDPDGIPSYVRHVEIQEIRRWNEPALLSRMLGNLSLLTELSLYETEIPEELLSHISRGEFGKGITTLCFWSSLYDITTITSFIRSLPDLNELDVQCHGLPLGEPLPICPAAPQKGPLQSLVLKGDVNGIGEALAESRFMFNRLSLDVDIANVERLLMLSSETVVELKLWDDSTEEDPPPIHLPSLPALTTLVTDLASGFPPSPRLTSILCSIGSAPALKSIVLGEVGDFLLGDEWVDVDRWLSRIVKHAKVKEGFSLTLKAWPEGKSGWEGFLPEFRESGGEIKVDHSR